MDTVRELSLLAALVTTGLMAGVYLAFSIAVLPGLARGDEATFVVAMRGMNAAILNPVFAVVFGGPLVLDVLALATRLPAGHREGSVEVAAALGLYVVTLVVTAVVNVPLNDRLDRIEDLAEAREVVRGRDGCAGTAFAPPLPGLVRLAGVRARLTGVLPEESCRFTRGTSLGKWWFH